MSVESVAEFCAVVAAEPELQTQLKSALVAGEGVPRFVAISGERGFKVTEDDVLAAFSTERQRRQQLEDDEYGETRIQKGGDDENLHPGICGLRTVALSGDWLIGGSEAESDNILD